MKNDSTSFFENNHFANSYVYDISISHVPAYFGLHWHHYIEIVLAQDDGIIYEVNGETFPLKPGDLLFIWPGELHAVSTTNREHRLIMLQLDADFLEKRVDFQSVAYLFYQIRLLNQNNFPEIEKLRGFLTELRRLSLSGISFSELRGCVLLYQFFYSARRKSLRADRNCRTAKNRPFRTGTPPDGCCMYLDLKSLHRTGFPGRSIKSRRILPLPFFQAVPRIHRPLLHGFRHQGTAPYRRKPVKKPDLTITEVSLESGFNSISTFNRVFLKSKNVSPTDFRQMYLQSYQK